MDNLLKVVLAIGIFYLGVFRLHATDRGYLIIAWQWFIASLFATAAAHLLFTVNSGRDAVQFSKAVDYGLVAMSIVYLYKSILTKRD